MKKLIYAFGALTLLLVSCSGDDSSSSSSVDAGTILVKKKIYTETGSPAETYNFTYNGNKLSKVTDEFGYSDVIYSGDLITQIKDYDDTNTLLSSESYTYNSSNKLTSIIYKDFESDYASKEVYTYNSDGTVSVSKYDGNTTSQTTYNGYYKMYFQNNEVVKEENYDSNGDLMDTKNYTFDGKNNPFKNIVGWAQLQYAESQMGGAFQNVLTETSTYNNFTITYTYDSNNFPLTETEKDDSNTVQSTIQYFY